MKHRIILLAGTASLLTAPAAAQDNGFRLQPAPTPTPRVVGPLPETPAPRPSPTPTPAPPPAIIAPTPTPTPRIDLPLVAAPTRTANPRRTPSAPAIRAPLATSPTPAPSTLPTPLPTGVSSATPAPPAPLPTFPSVAASEPPKASGSWWPWIIAGLLASLAGLAALWWLRRRIGPLGPVVVAEIERPQVPPPAPPATPVPAPAPARVPPAARPEPVSAAQDGNANPLHILIELRKLTLTLMYATLRYRLTLTNSGAEPLTNIAVAADLVGAHGSLPREAQLAGPATELPELHTLAGLAPGESGDVTGELRVPLNQLRPIAQGRAQLFVPLARFRIGAAGQAQKCFTLVTGQPSPSGNGAIQPVRLDLGPRSYDGLAGRAF